MDKPNPPELSPRERVLARLVELLEQWPDDGQSKTPNDSEPLAGQESFGACAPTSKEADAGSISHVPQSER